MAVIKPDSAVQEALEDRDPNNLNTHVQIVWDDIIGEPEGARSPECAWRLSNACFKHTRNWCYTILAVLIAPPCALILGCGFACLAFEVNISLSTYVYFSFFLSPTFSECAWRLQQCLLQAYSEVVLHDTSCAYSAAVCTNTGLRLRLSCV
ncbi:caveolin-3-like isoform X1 [Cydia pomonella]|uniref:caveolin-3-like isoform X1 n=1 Tax=Cydia pomonella TaxID=82600 RepID=UPI002ADE7236|nr:caveolin-3-like isoform X1 [Cydia pomonella]